MLQTILAEFQVNPDRDPVRIKGFDEQKLGEKIAIYYKGRPSYRRSLQLSTENIQHF
jgi:hypothetical protein